MHRVIVGFMVTLMFYSQPLLADSSDNKKAHPQNITGIRVEHKTTRRFVYNNKLYTVYADCKEIITQIRDSNYIILSPEDPIELKDENGNILLLYSVPCK
jgi:hypothetical protein